MRKSIYILLISAIIISFASCTNNGDNNNNTNSQNPTVSDIQNNNSNNNNNISDAKSISDYDVNTAVITLDNNVNITGTGVSNENGTIKIVSGGTYIFSGTLENGCIEVNTEDKVKIRLEGANITNKNGCAINIINAKKVKLVAVRNTENSLTDGTDYSNTPDAKGTIFSNDTLEIQGNGSLTINSNYLNAVASDDDIIISNGTINISSAVKNAFQAHDNITVEGGNITISNCKNGLNCRDGDIIINNGTINISDCDTAVYSNLDININNGTININNCLENFKSEKNIITNGGTINS